ncbi:ABC transporter substrate-binding protein [Streptomyces sp. NPDC003077]|uniref:ABC transporter substrate-binding protein n=1 Tax=Streptomyces sp. NPDC003077 TaxID=3154443 RepID=UPI0033A69BD6
MPRTNRRPHPAARAVPAILVSAALLCSCSAGAGAGGAKAEHGKEAKLSALLGTAQDSAGPAPAVSGARSGGTVHILNPTDAPHLDPQKVYSGETFNTSLLWGRQLTQYQVVDGKPKLVGDLATDLGRPSDGGRTWTFTLKKGIAWEDGKPVTAAHVKYGIERTFAPGFEVGPSYWPMWLTGSDDLTAAVKKYRGPKDGHLKVGGRDAIETPDDRTLVFHFPKPQSDVSFMATQSASSPVRPDKDTGTRYDVKPFATGPYRIVEHRQNHSMTLERNPHWKAETDPIRHQYVDRFEFIFGKKAVNSGQEILTGRGDGADSTSTDRDGLAPELFAEAERDPKKKDLVVGGRRGAYTTALRIKNTRVPDPAVRKAIHYLFPRRQIRQVLGGPRAGDLATTLSSPAVAGWRAYDLYPVAPTGDIAKAKEYLRKAKKPVTRLTYAYESTPVNDRVAQVLADAFREAGIELVRKPLSEAAFFDQVFRGPAPYDLWMNTTSVNWPTAGTLLPESFHSELDALSNETRYRNPHVDRELERIAGIGDLRNKTAELLELEQTVMKDVPVVPFLNARTAQAHGANVGGAFIHPIYGTISPAWLYLKKA